MNQLVFAYSGSCRSWATGIDRDYTINASENEYRNHREWGTVQDINPQKEKPYVYATVYNHGSIFLYSWATLLVQQSTCNRYIPLTLCH